MAKQKDVETEKAEKEKRITNEAELIVEAAPESVETEEVKKTTGAKAANEKALAKAGKRSAKATKEAEEKQAKEERKAQAAEEGEDKPKKVVKPTRRRLERQGKKFQAAAKLITKDKAYNLKEAVALAVKTSPVKFDASVELHVNLNVDPRHADQNVRDNLVLPAGSGKKVRVAVFDDEKTAGADVSGVEAILKQLEKGMVDFDILIATPAQMPKLGKYARVLGPRGLMPNPKSGTVTTDVAKAVQEAKTGRVEYRVDSTGIVHVAVGKVSFTPEQLLENLQAVLTSLKANKPASVKSNYVHSIHLTTTMGPSITITLSEF